MINFVLERVELEPNEMLDTSKVFGAPAFPKDFMNRHRLNEDYFFAQINLDELKEYDTPLPKEGMLYFFLRWQKYNIKPVVLYSKEELYEVMNGVNEIFGELDFEDALYMKFCEQGESGYLLDEFDQEIPEADRDDYIVLLKVDPLNVLASDFPIFNNPDDEIYFVISKEDLLANNFKKVKLFFHGS